MNKIGQTKHFNSFVAFLLGNVASAKTRNVFYVLGNDGIYVIDPEEIKMVKKITNTTSPGLCAKSSSTYTRLISQNMIVEQEFTLWGGGGRSVLSGHLWSGIEPLHMTVLAQKSSKTGDKSCMGLRVSALCFSKS